MARLFTPREARELIDAHLALRDGLASIEALARDQEAAVRRAADGIVRREALRLLRDVPVEELNRERGGIRVKLLREAGFVTVADAAAASVPALTVIHGAAREEALAAWLAQGGAAVTTYETAGRIALPEGFACALAVVDEAHYIKNPQAKRTQSVRALCARSERVLLMTGTALENRVDEMLALIELLRPDIAVKARSIAFLAAAPQFRRAIAPVYCRRRREDVLTELPELTETLEWCPLSPEEEADYERAVLAGDYTAVRRVSWTAPGNSSKARRLLELVDEAADEGRKVLVFSFYLDTVRAVCDLLGERCVNPITGAVASARRQEIVGEFEQAGPGAVLPAQIQTGGTGLNIQSASVVILCEPQFKPSVEQQAIARAYRMGQARNVLVCRLLCPDTADEKIMELLAGKRAVFDAFADRSAAAEEGFELDERSFGAIVEEEAARIREKRGEDTI